MHFVRKTGPPDVDREQFVMVSSASHDNSHQGNARCSGSSQNGVRGCLGIRKTNFRLFIGRPNEREMEETFDEELRHV